jgi:hypothetical protein
VASCRTHGVPGAHLSLPIRVPKDLRVDLEREKLPFAVGDSPFRIKGSGYILHMKYVDEHLPGGRAAMYAAMKDPALRAFFEQTFFAGHWVDIYPLVAVGYTCARILGVPFEKFIRLRSRHQADGDLHLFRKLILKIASPEMLATRIPAITASYFDFATAEVVEKKTASITARMHGVPREIAPWLAYVADETVRYMLEVNGVKNLRSQLDHEVEGVKDGQTICAIRSHLEWD